MAKWVHRLSNIRPMDRRADCAACGPDVRVKYRKHQDRWACRTPEDRRSPESRARQRVARREAEWRAIPGMDAITVADYELLLTEQGHACAICDGTNADGRALAVDHCHDSGRIRGLLCQRCNTALGLMQDDPERMLRAVQYVRAAAS